MEQTAVTAKSTKIDTSRLAEVRALSLKSGNHEPTDHEFCVMEAVAYIAGEPWSDAPQCACPVITAFMVSWNDSLPRDADRDRLLKPLVLELVGTRSTKPIEERRSYMALDWLIRVHTAKWLAMVPALASHAAALRDMEAIVDMAGATAAGATVRAAWAAAGGAARDAAWAAAGDAARAAARAAAGDAARAAAWASHAASARDAAWAAAGDAAWDAAWAAAWVAAGDAAGAAARDAAWAAAGDALKPTTAWLQTSAVDLVRRMIAAEAA